MAAAAWVALLVALLAGYSVVTLGSLGSESVLDFFGRWVYDAIVLGAAAAVLLRGARVLRGARLVRVVSSLNRGMGALGRSMGRRGLGYVLALSTLITFGGAAGMYFFEKGLPANGIPDYTAALWWTAMVMTTLGSSYWPQSGEGRVLCLLLSFYAFAVWGYVTASLATFFVGRDADNDEAEIPGKKEIEALRAELAGLRSDIRTLRTITR